MKSSRYIHNFLVELLDEAQAHSNEDNVAMAHAIIDIGLSDRTHHEQAVDLQEWVNNYAWAATDETTSTENKKQEGDAEASELDDDVKTDSWRGQGSPRGGTSRRFPKIRKKKWGARTSTSIP